MTPQELKNSILKLAIQGKLVEQRPEEGMAEELFARIQEEKHRLVKEKKIKKEKPLPEITEEEKPFDIPSSWRWVRLGNIGFTHIGLTYSPKNISKEGIIVLRSSNIQNDNMDYQDIVRVNMNIPENKMCHVGDILICVRNGSKRLVGKAAIVDREGMSFGAFMAIFRSQCNEYILQVINSLYFRNSLLGDTGTTTINQITQNMLKNVLIPLPPLAEQKRIVAKIEELLPYFDRYEQAWSELEKFNSRFPEDMKKSLLQYAIQGKLVKQRPEEGTAEELLAQIQEEKQRLITEKKIKKEKPLPEITEEEKPFDIPSSWRWVRLGNIGFTHIGLTYSPKNISKEGIIVLRSSNIQNDNMDYQDIVRVNMNIPENKMCHVGDILICVRNGSKRLVGKAAIVDREGMSFGAFMAIFRSQCNEYILQVINSLYFRNSLLGDTGTTTINQITQNMLKNVLIPLPPLAEQKRIVQKLEQLLPLCEQLR